MKKIFLSILFCIQTNLFAQDTQAQIDSIMNLYPNCTDYPTDVLTTLDSLLVALATQENEEIDTLVTQDSNFLSFLSETFPGLVDNTEINIEQALQITELNLDGLGLYNIIGISSFSNLEYLSIENNNLTFLPDLPEQVSTLKARWNNLVDIAPLPESIINLDLRNNLLNSIPELPNNIQDLKICYNNLTMIPNLPNNLEILFCAYNNFIELPEFPENLKEVLCYGNQIERLNTLPLLLETLKIQNNNLTFLPEIPENLQTLDISNNPIICVNNYPSHFEDLLSLFSQCILGCTDSSSTNFFIEANIDDGSCSPSNIINWPLTQEEINTGGNATYLIENTLLNDSIINEGFKIGAFYINDNGGLSCGGISFWEGGPSSIALYEDDLTTNQKDGFSQGDQIIWLATPLDSLELNYMATPNYISGSDQFLVNSINLIHEFVIFNELEALIGCTNSQALNFNPLSTIDDDSCIFQYELDIMELNDSIIELLENIDLLNNELMEANNIDTTIYYLENIIESWNISLTLEYGWNMVGYGCPNTIDVIEALSNYEYGIVIVKDNYGNAYLPEFAFNGIGQFSPGQGYQIKTSQQLSDFSICGWYVTQILEGK